MLRILKFQLIATVVVAVIAGLIGGVHAALSAVLGGAACVIPNGLFALRLTLISRRPGGANPKEFFLGEFVKVFSTIAVLVAIYWLYRDLVWLALLAGFVAALKSYLIVLIRA